MLVVSIERSDFFSLSFSGVLVLRISWIFDSPRFAWIRLLFRFRCDSVPAVCAWYRSGRGKIVRLICRHLSPIGTFFHRKKSGTKWNDRRRRHTKRKRKWIRRRWKQKERLYYSWIASFDSHLIDRLSFACQSHASSLHSLPSPLSI